MLGKQTIKKKPWKFHVIFWNKSCFALVSDTAAKDIFPKCVTNSQTHVSHTPQNITAQQHGIGFGDGNFSHIVIISNPNLSRVLLLGDRRKVSRSLQKTNLSHEGSIFLRRKKSDAKQQTRLFLFFTQTLQELRMLSSVTLNCQVTKIVWIQVLNCPNCNQCLKCHKSPGLSFQLSKWQKQLSELWKLSSIVAHCQNCKKNCQNSRNCQNVSKLSTKIKIVVSCQNCQKLSWLLKKVTYWAVVDS